MSSSRGNTYLAKASAGIVILLILIAVGWLSNRVTHSLNVDGIVFFILGVIGLVLMGFTLPEIGAGVRHAAGRSGIKEELERSAYFWEAAARNALAVGVLGSLMGFVLRLGSNAGAISSLTLSLVGTAWSTLYGFTLAGIFGIVALRVVQRLESEKDQSPSPSAGSHPLPKPEGMSWDRWVGYGLFLAAMLWVVLAPFTHDFIKPLDWYIHWPAWLVVAGGALVVGLLLGDPSDGRSLTLGLAYAGVIGALWGLIRALHGFAGATIQDVAGGLTIAISSCFAALAGMMLLGMPLQDRQRERRFLGLSRAAWYGFPLITLVILALVIAMVMIPFTNKNP